jgi:hypothetical protein
MCHVSHLLLGLSLLYEVPLLVWVASLWLVIGFILWVWEIVATMTIRSSVVTSLTHLFGITLAFFAILEVGEYADPVWPFAALFYIIMQLLSRTFTPKQLNVNAAHEIHHAMTPLFKVFLHYWVFNLVLQVAALYLFEFLLKTFL